MTAVRSAHELFRCPETGAALALEADALVGGGRRWPIVRGIPRFVATCFAPEPPIERPVALDRAAA